jgi:hypothetical protein
MKLFLGFLQIAMKAFDVSPPATAPQGWTAAAKAASTRRQLVPQSMSRRPEEWGEQEGYYRMGETCGQEPYTATKNGGVLNKLPLFGQDGRSRASNEGTCNKLQKPRKKLAPGIQVGPRLVPLHCATIILTTLAWSASRVMYRAQHNQNL